MADNLKKISSTKIYLRFTTLRRQARSVAGFRHDVICCGCICTSHNFRVTRLRASTKFHGSVNTLYPHHKDPCGYEVSHQGSVLSSYSQYQ
jgi:hypothetical protein